MSALTKLQRQATAYILSQKLSDELLEEIDNNSYYTLEDLVDIIVNEYLEEWQFCYIHSYKPDDPLIPEYIGESIDISDVESKFKSLLSSDSPKVSQETPFSKDRNMVQASGSREEYCKNQIGWFRQACVFSIRESVYDLIETASTTDSLLDGVPQQIDESQDSTDIITEITEDIVSTVGLWRWYILTTQAEESNQNTQDLANEWILSGVSTDIVDIIAESSIDESQIDTTVLIDSLSSFDSNSDILIT